MSSEYWRQLWTDSRTRTCSKYLSEKRDRSYKQLQHHFNDCSIVWSIVSISCGVLLILLMLLFYMYRDAQKTKKSWIRSPAWRTQSAPKSHSHSRTYSYTYILKPMAQAMFCGCRLLSWCSFYSVVSFESLFPQLSVSVSSHWLSLVKHEQNKILKWFRHRIIGKSTSTVALL